MAPNRRLNMRFVIATTPETMRQDIDQAWHRQQEKWMEERDVNCTVCNRSDCEPAAHAVWTEFDAERGVWIERASEEFFRDSITELNAHRRPLA